MKLHMHPVSTTSRPVMMFAALAELPLEMVVVDLMTGEHHGEAFTKLNPFRMVPVLQDGDFVLTESSAILKYLADTANSPLYPKDLKLRARVNERMDWFNTNFIRDWGYNLIYPQIFPHHKRASEDQTKATIEWGRNNALKALELLDQKLLGSNKYVCGDSISIADLLGAHFISLGEVVQTKFDKYPNVKRWLDGLKAMPAWKKTNETYDGFAASMAGKGLVSV